MKRRRAYLLRQAIRESVDATGQGAAFDYFILSDSTTADAWVAEERSFLLLRERLGLTIGSITGGAPKTPIAKPAISPILSLAGARLRSHAGA